jgi:hypothetical protein
MKSRAVLEEIGFANEKHFFVSYLLANGLGGSPPRLPTSFGTWLLISIEWTCYSDSAIRELITEIIADGAVSIDIWGRSSERVHVIAEELAMLDNPRAIVITIRLAWEDESSLVEKISHFIFSYTVGEQFKSECSWVVLSVDGNHSKEVIADLIKSAAAE